MYGNNLFSLPSTPCAESDCRAESQLPGLLAGRAVVARRSGLGDANYRILLVIFSKKSGVHKAFEEFKSSVLRMLSRTFDVARQSS
jgi:hypothetical protein